ncbi:hypothetical protein IQ07DRAFT_589386 [Pyrenochaeta sp. DS3sAY3a]|nr:hypothetical protein IQ07DRAFT_589386 [Pyrenochaeta sp. DS3sAY3a]
MHLKASAHLAYGQYINTPIVQTYTLHTKISRTVPPCNQPSTTVPDCLPPCISTTAPQPAPHVPHTYPKTPMLPIQPAQLPPCVIRLQKPACTSPPPLV